MALDVTPCLCRPSGARRVRREKAVNKHSPIPGGGGTSTVQLGVALTPLPLTWPHKATVPAAEGGVPAGVGQCRSANSAEGTGVELSELPLISSGWICCQPPFMLTQNQETVTAGDQCWVSTKAVLVGEI